MSHARSLEAQRVLAKWLPRTRMVAAQSLANNANQQVYLKLESELPTGSFKVRGALYALHANLQRRTIAEVVASSTGNHGAAVAYAARVLGVKARIFVPENCNPVKRRNIEQQGAAIEERGAIDLAAAWAAALDYSRKSGAFFLNDATDEDVPDGAGTIALETFEQVKTIDAIFVPMGDTALIRGVASAAKEISPAVRIVGVQSERAPSYFLSWKDGRAIETETCDTIADGLATRTPVAANVAAIRELVDEVVLVSEAEMLNAIARLLLDEHLVAEPAGAAAAAAYAKMRNPSLCAAVLLVTGANLARPTLQAAAQTADQG